RGTSFHRAVELACSPVRLDPARLSCCCGSLPGPAELGAVNPDAMHDHGQPARQRHDCLLHPAVLGDLHRPGLEPGPFCRTHQQDLGRFNGPQLLAREDIDVSREMRRILSDEGIQVLVEAELLQVRARSGDKGTLCGGSPWGEQHINGSDMLVAFGRIPNTVGIGLEEAGVELEGRGYIRVNGRLETSAPDVWAAGECAGSPQFTHMSEDDFRIIRDNLAGGNRSTHDRLVPYCMFTDPPLAHVGLSEGEAERQGVITRVARLPMDSVLGAQATDQRQGFMKAIVGDGDDRILGFTMIGAAAGEVMAAVQTAMLGGLPYSSLADADFAHPTMAE